MSNQEKVLSVKNYENIATSEDRKKIIAHLQKAFASLNPAKISGNYLKTSIVNTGKDGNLYVIGFGKASLEMYKGIREFTKETARFSCVIVPKGEGNGSEFPELLLLEGNHPIPGKDTLESSINLMSHLNDLSQNDTVISLISGGGSALFEIPEKGISIQDMGELARCLMASGADIHELNTARQLMSSVKGGKLAEKLYPARIHCLLISDVPGDLQEFIASGPLVRPSSTPEDRIQLIEKFEDSCNIIRKISEVDCSREIGDRFFANIESKIILKNGDFVHQIAASLREDGETVLSPEEQITGNVTDVALMFAEIARKGQHSSVGSDFWIIAGGETTTEVKGNGIGGRNCELSLRFALEMEPDEEFTFASIGTDGIDGISPAMGGITDTDFMSKVTKEEILQYLGTSDSYTLLANKGSAIITGYTMTNVSDLFILHYAGNGKRI